MSIHHLEKNLLRYLSPRLVMCACAPRLRVSKAQHGRTHRRKSVPQCPGITGQTVIDTEYHRLRKGKEIERIEGKEEHEKEKNER